MHENRYGYTAYPTSYKWRLFGSLSASVYTTASVHRCAFPPVDADPTKFAGPTSFAERGTGRKGAVGESGSKLETDEGRTRRNQRGSSVAIARVMLPVSLLLLPLLTSSPLSLLLLNLASPSAVHLALVSSVLQQGGRVVLGLNCACNIVHDSPLFFDREIPRRMPATSASANSAKVGSQ